VRHGGRPRPLPAIEARGPASALIECLTCWFELAVLLEFELEGISWSLAAALGAVAPEEDADALWCGQPDFVHSLRRSSGAREEDSDFSNWVLASANSARSNLVSASRRILSCINALEAAASSDRNSWLADLGDEGQVLARERDFSNSLSWLTCSRKVELSFCKLSHCARRSQMTESLRAKIAATLSSLPRNESFSPKPPTTSTIDPP